MLKLNLQKLGLLFFDITFFLFAFMGLDSDSFTTKLNIFYIPGNKNMYHFFICIVFLVMFVWIKKGKIRIDLIVVLLGIKLIYDYINSFYVQHVPMENWVRWFQTDIGFLSYFVGINTIVKPKDLLKRFELFVTIISIQVFHVFLLNKDLTEYVFKNAMRIPFALSNVIAGVLVAGAIAVILDDGIKPRNRMLLCTIYMGGGIAN